MSNMPDSVPAAYYEQNWFDYQDEGERLTPEEEDAYLKAMEETTERLERAFAIAQSEPEEVEATEIDLEALPF